MTTIAWDGTRLAADTQSTRNDLVVSVASDKITAFTDGTAFGYTGANSDRSVAEEWIERGMKWPAPEFDGAALIVPRRGRAFILESKAAGPVLSSFRYQAIGSGAAIALGAMASGGTATAAVRAAIRHDVYSGGRVRSFKLR